MRAPEGSIINCTFPASVGSRTNTGWYIHAAIFGALAQVLPGEIQAGNGLMSSLRTYGFENGGRVFNAHLFCGGGRGATSAGDGMGLNNFPSSASNVPVEVFELNSPALVVAKEFIPDSGRRWKVSRQSWAAARYLQAAVPLVPAEHLLSSHSPYLSPAGHLRRQGRHKD